MATIYGTKGSDLITGTSGDDIIYGLGGRDVIHGGDGNDEIWGGPGSKDWLYGDAGNDVLKGGGGQDSLNGGTGADQFVFREADGLTTPVFAFTGGHGVTEVAQWVIINDLSFADHDEVRITDFAGVFGSLNISRPGTGSYFIDDQGDVNAIVNYLKGHPDQGFSFEIHGTQYDGTTLMLKDGNGHFQALTLNGIHPDTIAL
ncbi:MAG: hypothetical protein RIS94_1712 [Pseudomonadota bacterium]|jgi:Ca2+-binding RTX toxin-like protein